MAALALAGFVLAASPAVGEDAASPGADRLATSVDPPILRVCADPNNLPFSNEDEEGFENKLADLVADELGATIEYTWWAERRGFLRNTLNAGACDVVMGTPPIDFLTPTQAYYNSTYVFVSRAEDAIDVATLTDPKLRDLTIGVHLIGDDGANTPAVHVLGEQEIVDNVVGYSIYGNYDEDSPPSRLVKDVAAGEIDIAVVWGPLAGFYAKHSETKLTVTPLEETVRLLPLVFQFPIGMGVRKDDHVLKDRLNAVIAKKHKAIEDLLDAYGIPRV
ncbi:putative methanol oxidation protein [Fulvimarina pelagi HTCC2506]|uniref:Putative methanol oxidation protein n=1 Tax=Fulvimarina pelagi HTCC2506 TaxID=314231 RepID=Q0FY19_9HYPH|nr:putative methanol oxidation protein [Fulvimarina pelagi HTCC2506]